MPRSRNLFAILLVAALAPGCSMLAKTSSSTPISSSKGGVSDQYEGVKEMPVSLRNMKRLGENIGKELTRLEEGTGDGTIAFPGRDLTSTRTNLTSYYGYGQKGGSEECEACKNHPSYEGLRENYAALDKRQRALEEKYMKCNFGYQMSNGDILHPTFEWSAEEWAKIREKSKHKTGRCWLIANPEESYRN